VDSSIARVPWFSHGQDVKSVKALCDDRCCETKAGKLQMRGNATSLTSIVSISTLSGPPRPGNVGRDIHETARLTFQSLIPRFQGRPL
jgi:hypothetical protein